ncbi:hypothetical protein JOL79_04210 [Microbispora sp. RL4-1S]|uniref:Secreted protein n=1 Tax=Microbispora oryzae TaxID=2806554 RepID=A0A940WCN2_9ACTN|nr:hypothetical protein [Microbispora oryzae]MBP2703006.1 hypothetical protein [Microbispora oryzae]
MRTIIVVAALTALMALTACGSAGGAAEKAAGGETPAVPRTRYQADATVLSDARHGPQLCADVLQSMPPQCSGPDVAGWDWDAVKHSSQGGTSWGEYHVVGTWDGTRLTLTEPARPAAGRQGSPDDLTSPCPEPAGGWRPVAPAKATGEAMDAVLARARALPGYAGSWLDQSYLDEIDGYDDTDRRWVERYANDPKRLVLNLRFTGDPAAREAAIREVWGGALCLSRARHTEAELRALQERATKEIKGIVSASVDQFAERVELGVWVVTPELRREVDERYGKGLVALNGFLTPVGS